MNKLFVAVWDESSPKLVKATGETKEEAVANLQAELIRICEGKGFNTDNDPPLEIDQNIISCGGYCVGYIEES